MREVGERQLKLPWPRRSPSSGEVPTWCRRRKWLIGPYLGSIGVANRSRRSRRGWWSSGLPNSSNGKVVRALHTGGARDGSGVDLVCLGLHGGKEGKRVGESIEAATCPPLQAS
jgi:hypothetical protein